METFIATNPGVILGIMGGLVLVVVYFLRQSLENNTAAMRDIRKMLMDHEIRLSKLEP